MSAEIAKHDDDSAYIYLKQISISNFRAIEKITVTFNPRLNVIIGQNNIGKSAIMDAISISLEVGKYKKNSYIKKEDFKDEAKEIGFDLIFHLPTTVDGYHELLSKEGGLNELHLHIRYELKNVSGQMQIRPRYWGGNNEGHKLDEATLVGLHVEYLGALRDAGLQLKPSVRGKIAELLGKLRGKVEQKDIEELYREVHEKDLVKALVKEAEESVAGHITKIALDNDHFDVLINPLPPEFEKLAGGFEMRLSKDGREHDIFQNGLGYNNVLFISTVLGHIQTAKKMDKDEYYALLIEEPEAHLHPQLESRLFSYISDLGSGVGAQVIATSHSPVISSKVALDDLIVLNRTDKGLESLSIKDISFGGKDNKNKSKLSRYLNVTESQLFFAKKILLVEGITETLLLPFMADAHFKSKKSLQALGAEIVNINGVSFEPFADLFTGTAHIPVRAAILTDKDPYTDDDGVFHSSSSRADNIKAAEANTLHVSLSSSTFEIDLWDAGNDKIMKVVAERLFPRSSFASGADIIASLKSSNTTGKGEFAQELAYELEEKGTDLIPPAYIIEALDWIKGNGIQTQL